MQVLNKLGRHLHIDDGERIGTYRRLLAEPNAPYIGALPERERRLLHMLVASLTDQVITRENSLQEAVDLLWAHPQVRDELLELAPDVSCFAVVKSVSIAPENVSEMIMASQETLEK